MNKTELLVGVSEAKRNIAEIIDSLDRPETIDTVYLIAKHGRPKAVIISKARFDAMMDLLEDVEDERDSLLGQRIAEARENYESGKAVNLRESLKRRSK